MRTIKILTISDVEYDTENGDYVRDGEGNYGSPWETVHNLGEDYATEAVDILRNAGCDQYSSTDWQRHGWYSAETYVNHYTGRATEFTAHLDGFTDEESREIHALITGALVR